MRQHRPADGTGHLNKHEMGGSGEGDLAAQQKSDGHGWIEMRPRHRTEHRDQHIENGASRDGVAKKGNRHITAGQPLGHDPRPDDRGQQDHGAGEFGNKNTGCFLADHGNSPMARMAGIMSSTGASPSASSASTRAFIWP